MGEVSKAISILLEFTNIYIYIYLFTLCIARLTKSFDSPSRVLAELSFKGSFSGAPLRH